MQDRLCQVSRGNWIFRAGAEMSSLSKAQSLCLGLCRQRMRLSSDATTDIRHHRTLLW